MILPQACVEIERLRDRQVFIDNRGLENSIQSNAIIYQFIVSERKTMERNWKNNQL